MGYVENISIRKRIMCIFLVWVLLFIGFGVFATNQIRHLKEVTTDIYDQSLKILDVQSELHANIIKMQKKMRSLVLIEDEAEIYEEISEINMLELTIDENLSRIRDEVVDEEETHLKNQILVNAQQWKHGLRRATDLILEGQQQEAGEIIIYQNASYVESLEENLRDLNLLEYNKANSLIEEANRIEKDQVIMLNFLLVFLVFIGAAIFIIGSNSILQPVLALKNVMSNNILNNNMEELTIAGKNEIADMANHYNQLIRKLKEEFWVKNGENELRAALQGDVTIEELTQGAIQHLSRMLDAGMGVFYLYDEDQKKLKLQASYALSDKENFSKEYLLGEGTIGQVALEKKPILLKNIKGQEVVITTGILQETSLNTYTFPLIYEGKVYGVIELAFFEAFTELKQNFIQKVAPIIAINLYATLQNNKVKDLLHLSEEAKKRAEETASLLQGMNQEMEEQQQLLHQQSSELQQSNAQLEEQQSLLEEQSQELQTFNAQLEEKQKQLEEQSSLLSLQNIQLKKSNEIKTEFLANVSHELRTPLNSIILLSKLILKNNKNHFHEEDLEKLNIIYQSGNELLRLINDILDLSKIESGKLDLHITECASKDLLKELQLMFKDIAKEKGIEFVVEDLVQNNIVVDKNKVSQILRNFLSNAFKFTEEGSVTLRVQRDPGGGLLFSVEDTGIGISGDKQEMIFQEFRQIDGSNSRKYGGTGLGLPIAKKLAALMEGEIKVDSKEGVGSKFTLYLHGEMSETIEGEEMAYRPYSTVTITGYSEVSSSISNEMMEEEKTILVIEDDTNFANIIKKINTDLGFNTVMATTGKEGLRLAVAKKIDGIILDLGLPDMDGLEVLKTLKGTKELKTIPVHILSAWDKDYELQKRGAIGYKEKPAKAEEIVELISKLISFSTKETKELLIIEDRAIISKNIRKKIQVRDTSITTVNTESKGIKELNKGMYDVILLDWHLKKGNALSICQYMSKYKIEIPIIIYVDGDLSVEEEKVLNQYASNIVLKTTNSIEMLLDEATLFLHKLKKQGREELHATTSLEKDGDLSLKDKEILIVDDDARNIFVLAAALENHGAMIHDAENGEVALEKLKQVAPDLILMDIMMPIMDGYETMKAIRENQALDDIPIIALTAKTLKEDKAKCIEAGANDYLAKPVDYDTLIHLVKAWISKE